MMDEHPARSLMNTIGELEGVVGKLQQRIKALEEERGSLYDQIQSQKRDTEEFRERVQGLIARIEELENQQSSSRLF